MGKEHLASSQASPRQHKHHLQKCPSIPPTTSRARTPYHYATHVRPKLARSSAYPLPAIGHCVTAFLGHAHDIGSLLVTHFASPLLPCPPPTMAASLASLLARASIDDPSEALSIADAALASSKSDLTAQHTKVVALLRLDQYDDALRVIAAAGTALEERCILEKTYALYKTGALDDAAALLEGRDIANADRPLKHVAAQIAYRTERFSQAAELYSLLMEDDSTAVLGEDTDLVINQLATHAQLEWQGRGDLVPDKSKQPKREDMEAFETAYNAGCGCVARGDLAKASILLKRAADLCDAAEDLSDEDKKVELLPIRLQQAYVFTLLGKTEEATALQKETESYE